MKVSLILLLFVIGSWGATIVWGYETDTHEEMSQKAAEKSVIFRDAGLLNSFGLKPVSQKQKFPNSEGSEQDIVNLIRDGARFEDDGIRPRHHFYDPVNNRGLQWGLVRGEKSPDWALEDKTDFSTQIRSLREARDYLYRAITGAEEKGRKRYFGLTFQTLGQVVHHIQDMAQPQHVRNDVHLDYRELGKKDSPLEAPSFYEYYTRDVADLSSILSQSSYPLVHFSRARRFWVTEEGTGGRGKGLSEFTNNNFVSAGTNFKLNDGVPVTDKDGYDLPGPGPLANPEAIETLLAKRGDTVPCGTRFDTASGCLEGNIQFISSTVTDNRTGEVRENKYAASLSIFDADLQKYNTKVIFEGEPDPLTGNVPPTVITNRKFTLNRFNFDAAHEFLIPRAVGYSVWFMDYFFQRQLAGEAGATKTTCPTGGKTWNV